MPEDSAAEDSEEEGRADFSVRLGYSSPIASVFPTAERSLPLGQGLPMRSAFSALPSPEMQPQVALREAATAAAGDCPRRNQETLESKPQKFV